MGILERHCCIAGQRCQHPAAAIVERTLIWSIADTQCADDLVMDLQWREQGSVAPGDYTLLHSISYQLSL